MNSAVKVGLFLFILWAFGFVLIGASDADRNVREWYLLLPIIAPFALMVVLQLAIWLGRGIERLTGRTL